MSRDPSAELSAFEHLMGAQTKHLMDQLEDLVNQNPEMERVERSSTVAMTDPHEQTRITVTTTVTLEAVL